MKVLVDTSFIYGLFIRKSSNYEEAQKILDFILNQGQFDLFLTIDPVIQETYSVFSNRVHDAKFLETLDDFFYGPTNFIEIIYPEANRNTDQQIISIIKQALQETPKRILSFIDASLIFFAKQLNLEYIITFDGHFKKDLKSYPIF
jgi:predicted nucleic acid-binding protein